MTTTYFLLSLFGAWLTFNLYKPFIERPRLSILSFMFGWLGGELVYFVFTVQLLGTLLFVAAGAVNGFFGALGLLLTIASWVGMALYLQRAMHTDEEIESALQTTLGADYQQSIKPELLAQVPTELDYSRLVRPFSLHLPQVECIKDVIYYEENGVKLGLDIYCKRTRPENAPVLFQIHGGGWTEKMGSKDHQALPLMNQLAAMGWVCVAVSYRLSPTFAFPTHIIDCKRGLAWTKEHINEYGGNPEFIVATGGSAGGHLSSLLALTANLPDFQPDFEDVDTSVKACVPFYGVFDFSDENQLQNHSSVREYLEEAVMQLPLSDTEAYRKASPLHHLHKDAPPFFVIHGTCDSLTSFKEGEHFAAELSKVSSQPVVFAPLGLAQHAFDIFRSPRSEYVMFGVMRYVNYIYSLYLQQSKLAKPRVRKTRKVKQDNLDAA
ncbi:MAG: alpha/beta hydrolase fold domain-containing protein [Pseudomonadales bacterium]